MEEFLTKINLEQYWDVFNANDITLDIAQKLTKDELKELIPSMGQRKLFSESLWQISDQGQVEKPEVQVMEYELGENNCLVDITNKKISAILDITEASTSSATSAETTSGIAESSILVADEHRQVAFCGLENFFTPIILPDFDLKTLLETTPLGATILNYYSKNKILNNTKRSLLVDIIIKKVFNFLVTHRFTHSDYNILTAKIVTLFPKECAGTYYVPAVSKRNSISNRPIVAKGKLVDKVRNLLRVNREMQSDKITQNPKEQKVFHEKLKEEKVWLDTRNDPWPEVLEKWRKTFDMRRSCDVGTMDSFFQQWPIVKDPRSSILIDIDFELMYPESTVNIHVNWFQFMEKLMSIKRGTLKDKVACQYLELIEEGDCSEDTKVAVHVYLLAHLIPPKSRIKLSNKKHWKFSSAEVLESLLMHVKVPGDIQESICNYRDKMYQMNQTVQPYVLIEGPTIQDIRSVYVIVDKIRFKCDTLLKALDLNFKLFHVANACYPKQSEYLWMLIQKCIYKITTAQDTVIPYILDIIEIINNY